MDRPFESLAEIDRIVRGFLDCTLPCEQWTHRAHLTVGLCHARQYPADEALLRVREGIKRYNVNCGKANTDSSGYHETITRLYMKLIGRFLAETVEQSDWVRVTNALFARHGGRDVPFEYYSRDRLLSSAARLAWVPPDLRPIE